MYYSTTCSSPIGTMTLVSDANNLVGLWLEKQKYSLSEAMTEKNELSIFYATKNWLDRYFAGEKPTLSELAIAPVGGKFRQEVWAILCEIPYGEVVTYGDIAKKIAVKMNKKNMSSQAIGGAVGHNPISIIIPCHRVVGANGSLTGYGGGIRRKQKLLELEGVDMSKLFVPKRGTAL